LIGWIEEIRGKANAYRQLIERSQNMANFLPFCLPCFRQIGTLEFQCCECPKMALIMEQLKRYDEELSNMASIAATNIMENYERRKQDELQKQKRRQAQPSLESQIAQRG